MSDQDLTSACKLNLPTIVKTSKNLKMQSKEVADKIYQFMESNNSDGKLSWDDFREMIQVLLPMNLEDQITLFLQSYVPVDLVGEEIDKFKFTIQDVR